MKSFRLSKQGSAWCKGCFLVHPFPPTWIKISKQSLTAVITTGTFLLGCVSRVSQLTCFRKWATTTATEATAPTDWHTRPRRNHRHPLHQQHGHQGQQQEQQLAHTHEQDQDSLQHNLQVTQIRGQYIKMCFISDVPETDFAGYPAYLKTGYPALFFTCSKLFFAN